LIQFEELEQKQPILELDQRELEQANPVQEQNFDKYFLKF